MLSIRTVNWQYVLLYDASVDWVEDADSAGEWLKLHCELLADGTRGRTSLLPLEEREPGGTLRHLRRLPT